MTVYNPDVLDLTQYIFFTGKGGVGKTSTACATAIKLSDSGKKVLLISTDPASNLQDVFETELSNEPTQIDGIPNLTVINLDPVKAAEIYRERVIAPYRGLLPDVAIQSMEEQLSGSCTVEIAAFNEFSGFLANQETRIAFDHIIFDTAPTGHTLRMLQLPSAWSNFISESTHGASCLGQLSGLEEKKEAYEAAVRTLSSDAQTVLMLVTRPEESPLNEAARASFELSALGINNQRLIINGVLDDFNDQISQAFFMKQQAALTSKPKALEEITTFKIPLRGYNITGLSNLRRFLTQPASDVEMNKVEIEESASLSGLIKSLDQTKKKVIFTMGKGGVGKTTIAAAIALGLAKLGNKVHLSTTDPAAHLKEIIEASEMISISHIDEAEELQRYKDEVLSRAKKSMSNQDLAYVEEDLRSPCTQEIAVFRAFAEIVDRAEDEIVVIDTAPTGHTLLLLDATQSYHREIERSHGDIPESVRKLLPRLRNKSETECIIVTHAEATPVYEALRLEDDLNRAGLSSNWWVVNATMHMTETQHEVLKAKANGETVWIQKVSEHASGNCAVVSWNPKSLKGNVLLDI